MVSSSVSPSSIAKVGKEFSARDVREEKILEARVLPAVCEADQERVLDCLRKRVFKFVSLPSAFGVLETFWILDKIFKVD